MENVVLSRKIEIVVNVDIVIVDWDISFSSPEKSQYGLRKKNWKIYWNDDNSLALISLNSINLADCNSYEFIDVGSSWMFNF